MKNIEVKGAILEFMRRKCYAPLNAEALIAEIPIEGPQLSEFWKSLLELEDHELWALVSGREATEDQRQAAMIERLREVSPAANF